MKSLSISQNYGKNSEKRSNSKNTLKNAISSAVLVSGLMAASCLAEPDQRAGASYNVPDSDTPSEQQTAEPREPHLGVNTSSCLSDSYGYGNTGIYNREQNYFAQVEEGSHVVFDTYKIQVDSIESNSVTISVRDRETNDLVVSDSIRPRPIADAVISDGYHPDEQLDSAEHIEISDTIGLSVDWAFNDSSSQPVAQLYLHRFSVVSTLEVRIAATMNPDTPECQTMIDDLSEFFPEYSNPTSFQLSYFTFRKSGMDNSADSIVNSFPTYRETDTPFHEFDSGRTIIMPIGTNVSSHRNPYFVFEPNTAYLGICNIGSVGNFGPHGAIQQGEEYREPFSIRYVYVTPTSLSIRDNRIHAEVWFKSVNKRDSSDYNQIIFAVDGPAMREISFSDTDKYLVDVVPTISAETGEPAVLVSYMDLVHEGRRLVFPVGTGDIVEGETGRWQAYISHEHWPDGTWNSPTMTLLCLAENGDCTTIERDDRDSLF